MPPAFFVKVLTHLDSVEPDVPARKLYISIARTDASSCSNTKPHFLIMMYY